MLDGFAELKTPAARALQDSNVYAKEAIAPGLPDASRRTLKSDRACRRETVCPRRFCLGAGRAHRPRRDQREKGRRRLLQIRRTKLHPTDKAGNDTMRWLMLEQGLPVRKAWQEYIKHWTQINAGMLSMVGGAGRFMPRYMGGGIEPRSAWQEPIGARSSRGNGGPGAGNPGGGGPKPSNTIVESPPAPKPSHQQAGRRERSAPPPGPDHSGKIPQWAKRERSSGNPPPMQPPAPGPKAPAADPAAGAHVDGKNIVAGKGQTLPGSIYRKVGKPPEGPPPEIRESSQAKRRHAEQAAGVRRIQC